MTDVAEPIAKLFRFRLVLAVVLGGLLWLADGRVWPSVARYVSDSFLLLLLAQWSCAGWFGKTRSGRVLVVVLNAVMFWGAGEGLARTFAEGGRTFVLAGAALVLVLVSMSFAWDRLSPHWRVKLSAARGLLGALACMGALGTAVVLWFFIGAVAEKATSQARIGLTALLLAMCGGLVLALWRLEGWVRTGACWAIGSLTWAGLMTGLATGASAGGVGVGGWLLTVVPPLIAAGVMFTYWRVARTYGV